MMDNGMTQGMTGGGGIDWLILLLLLFGQGRNGLFGNGNQDAISNEFQMTQGKLDNLTASTNAGFSNTQMSFAAVAQQLAKCCCDIQLQAVTLNNDTNRHVDQINFEQTVNNSNNTQRVIDRIDAFQDSVKDQRIRDLETQLGACNTRDTVGAAIAPISATLANIMAQLNCGVKAVQYSPSLPVFSAPYAPAFAYAAPFGSNHGCHGNNWAYGNQGFPG